MISSYNIVVFVRMDIITNCARHMIAIHSLSLCSYVLIRQDEKTAVAFEFKKSLTLEDCRKTQTGNGDSDTWTMMTTTKTTRDRHVTLDIKRSWGIPLTTKLQIDATLQCMLRIRVDLSNDDAFFCKINHDAFRFKTTGS